jgi:hypothetical protein
LFWWLAARLQSSHSRFRSLAFSGTLYKQSRVTSHDARSADDC